MDRARRAMEAAMTTTTSNVNTDSPDSFGSRPPPQPQPHELSMLDMEELRAKPEELEPALIRKRPRESQIGIPARRTKSSAAGPGGLVDDLIASVSHRDDRNQGKNGEDGAEVVVKAEPVDKRSSKPGSRSPSPETARKRARTARAQPTDSTSATTWAPRDSAVDAQRTRSSMINSSRDRAFGQDQPGPSKPAIFPSTSATKEPASSATVPSTSSKTKDLSMPPSRQMSTNSSNYDPTVFEGLTFTHQIEGPVELFEDAVRGMGGTLVPYARWQDGEAADYVVCRL